MLSQQSIASLKFWNSKIWNSIFLKSPVIRMVLCHKSYFVFRCCCAFYCSYQICTVDSNFHWQNCLLKWIVLKISVWSCTQNLVQEAEKWKISFSRWPFLCCQDSSDNVPAVMRTILNSGFFWSWWEGGGGCFVMLRWTLPAWSVADLLAAFQKMNPCPR